MKTTVTYVGTATVLIQAGGLNLLTDPAFDHAPTAYPTGPVTLRSLVSPAVEAGDLPVLDAILLSHDEHPDNLDAAGRALLAGHLVLTTVSGAQRLGDGAVGLAPWETYELSGEGGTLRVTATPGRHAGDVIGFLVHVPGDDDALYISGDTVYYDELDEIGRRYSVGAAILHFGAAVVPYFGTDFITMDGDQGARLTRSLDVRTVVPVHYDAWDHFTQGREEIVAAFTRAGLDDRLHWPQRGVPTVIDTRPVCS
ncbi:MBL fold metallo-hydrolase [Micromonospora endophytica]|uniref:MBL fold metallo-hydrolase n=1 Tax=Micromonospora endophytica TaxID=515350 RepID=A0A2W2D2W1_9ACTN|nr:MBL fold metallo-hydrolase [Micromonospora endophytica]PZF94487.1 MBL fold metallo-hydrolase [Micromonospora endophytica]RIW43892.1 MBL fold metallo-hydrolase [Micromonospora endophytica]BCJ56931.1 MBL fold metallo-hydrolase [Micromonospora endophytica]